MSSIAQQKEKILKIGEKQCLLTARDVEAKGISRNYLYLLFKEGSLKKMTRGIYCLPQACATEHLSMIEVARQVPNAVICLLSALSFYGLTTQLPHEVWISIPQGSWRPRIPSTALRLTFAAPKLHSFGVRTASAGGIHFKIYSPAKTVADCFKFRSKVGLNVAIEALNEVLKTKKASVDEITRAAKACRIFNVMRPYLETLLRG